MTNKRTTIGGMVCELIPARGEATARRMAEGLRKKTGCMHGFTCLPGGRWFVLRKVDEAGRPVPLRTQETTACPR